MYCFFLASLAQVRTRERGKSRSHPAFIHATEFGAQQKTSVLIVHHLSLGICNNGTEAAQFGYGQTRTFHLAPAEQCGRLLGWKQTFHEDKFSQFVRQLNRRDDLAVIIVAARIAGGFRVARIFQDFSVQLIAIIIISAAFALR